MNLIKMRVSGKNRILVLTAALLACSLSSMRTGAQEAAGVEDGLIEEDLQILDGSSNTEVAQETSAALETEEADAGTKKESDVQETEGADGGMTKEPAAQPDAADQIIASMTNEEKAAQLFMVTPEVLTGSWNVTAAGPATAASFDAIPVGGLIYMEGNIQSYAQTQEMLTSMSAISMNRLGLPILLATDEEGGRVRRISGRIEGVPYIEEMLTVGASADTQYAYDTGAKIGTYMKDLGFNVDLAPVADVLTNPSNSVIGNRSLSSDPAAAGTMISWVVQGLSSQGVCATLKHFPGHGDTAQDSHSGMAVSYKSLDELRRCEFLPFAAGIAAGADLVMTGHISLPNVTGDDVPATLSRMITTDILRGELGFEGVIITDALNMGAITSRYNSGDAALQALQAGADIILMPADFSSAYYTVLDAINNETIDMDQIHASLHRIISLKLRLMGQSPQTEQPAQEEAQPESEQPAQEETQTGVDQPVQEETQPQSEGELSSTQTGAETGGEEEGRVDIDPVYLR